MFIGRSKINLFLSFSLIFIISSVGFSIVSYSINPSDHYIIHGLGIGFYMAMADIVVTLLSGEITNI